MIRLSRKNFSLITVLFQKLKYKYAVVIRPLDEHSPLMQWRVPEQLTLILATQQINSGFGVAVRSGGEIN